MARTFLVSLLSVQLLLTSVEAFLPEASVFQQQQQRQRCHLTPFELSAVNGDSNSHDNEGETTAVATTATPTVEETATVVSSTNSSTNASTPPSSVGDSSTTAEKEFDVLEIPNMLTRMANDVMRRVRWGDKVTPAASASLYMNPATQRLATNLTVSWEPDVADMIKALYRLRSKSAAKKQPLLIGVVGIPGSGKSTSCEILASCIGEKTLVMPMDGYHLSLEQLAQMPDPADVIYRRGAPDTFDPQSLLHDLKRIKIGNEPTVTIPGFDHAVGDPTPNQHTFRRDNHDIVIVEGIYLMHPNDGWKEVRGMLDFCIYIQADIDVCIERLKIRNQCIPGYTPEEIEVRCEAVDRVNAETVLRSATFASLSVESSAMKSTSSATQDRTEAIRADECDFVSEEEIEQYVETVKEEAEAIIKEL